MPTLHVRCGSDIRLVLAEARLEGDFLEFSDPVCQGPTPSGLPEAEFREARARFIADNYGLSIGEARRRLEREASGLAAAGDYERIVLWFEHDLYDQGPRAAARSFRRPTRASRPSMARLHRWIPGCCAVSGAR